ncbi:MAG: hypothetical protein IJP29_01570 [Lachnospiraceae bacterium]|nr:hypothetical protein [Lachnospiraceae bacterium]
MQAFLITAYKNQNQLVKLIHSLNKHALVFVHIDKKSTELNLQELNSLGLENTQFISKYNIPWGGYTHLLAILDLFKMALGDERVSYIHTISGQDIRIKPWEYIEDHFRTCENIYMTCFDSKDLPQGIKKRYTQRIVTSRGTCIRKHIERLNRFYQKVQNKLHISWSTIKPFDDVYKGVIWCSMPRHAAEYALDFSKKNPVFLRTLKHVSLPEEFFFQTIFMMSDYRQHVIKENLRFTDWTKRNGSKPAILDETDFDSVIQSNCIFARKIDEDISNELIKKVDAYLEGR